jgi:hypothetical protein
MGISTAAIVWGVLFGAVGAGYFLYGKRQREPVPMMCGVGLMVVPYLVSSTIALVVIGVLLGAVPFLLRE